MFKAVIDANRIVVTNPDREIITSGSVNVNFIQFSFSEDWADLQKTVLFQTKKALIPIILEGTEISYTMPIPWEVLLYANESINVGAYGTRMDDTETLEDEEIVLPTVWGTIPDKVRQGVIITDPTPTSPTYDAYQRLLKTISDLIENGIGEDGFSPSISIEETAEGAILTIVDINGEKKIAITNGVDGRDGLDGLSPIVSVIPIDGGNRLIITDINGEHSFDFLNAPGDELITFRNKTFTKLSDLEGVNFPCCIHLVDCELGGTFNDDIVYVKNSADILLHVMTVDNVIYEITVDQNGNFVELDVTNLRQKINDVATSLNIQLGAAREELEEQITKSYNPTWVAWSEEGNVLVGSDGSLTNSTLKIGFDCFNRIPKFNERGLLITKNRDNEYRLCYCTVNRFIAEEEIAVVSVDYMVRVDRHDIYTKAEVDSKTIDRCIWFYSAGDDIELFSQGKTNVASPTEFIGHTPKVNAHEVGLILVNSKLYWTEFTIINATSYSVTQEFTRDPLLIASNDIMGDGLSKDGDTVSVSTPVQGIYTQAEFDALPEEKKSKGLYLVDDGNPTSVGGGNGGVPSGVIVMWSGDKVPDGWALCNGDNGTPDLQGKFVLGSSEKYVIGTVGGSEEVTLTVAEMPKHHHSENWFDGSTVKHLSRATGTYTSSVKPTATTSQGSSAIVPTDDAGSSQAHSNMPPYYVLAYIMKL